MVALKRAILTALIGTSILVVAGWREHSRAARDARRQPDTVQSGKDRGKVASSIGLDKPKPDAWDR